MTAGPRSSAAPGNEDLLSQRALTVPVARASSTTTREDPGQAAADRPESAPRTPHLPGLSLTHRLHGHLAGGAAPGGDPVRGAVERFQVLGHLGSGATSHVYAVLDLNLQRQIAVKVLDLSITDGGVDLVTFIDEARINADLRHPNVVPVHDLDITDAGQLFFAMNHIDGQTLGDLLRRATLAERGDKLGSFNAIVGIFLAIGNAVAYAHHKRIVHQDLKPDNILIGDFGEVLVLDWGSAVRVADGSTCDQRLYGTPLYMSPEQARSSHVDTRSDIYCLGATLFHALTLRLPTWSEDVDEFWRRKRVGSIDPPTGDERAAIPAALLDIALKAMAPRAQDRYPTMEAFSRDLESYQAGLAVSAHRDSLGELVARLHRKHWRLLWSAGSALALIIILVLALYGERLKEMAAWGRPTISEDFADGHWQERWLVVDEAFHESTAVQVEKGWLRTSGPRATYVFNRTRLTGPLAIEFDARLPAHATPGDLSIVISQDDPTSPAGDGVLFDATHVLVMLQTGAEDNAFAAIVKHPGGYHATTSPFRLKPDTIYHMRMESDGGRLSISVDDRLICEFTDDFPVQSGFVGLYGYYPGKEFSRVRIFSKGVPEKIGVLTIGDSYFLDGLFERAADSYRKVTQSHAGKPIGQEALYKLGLAQLRLGEAEAAAQTWKRIADAHWSGMAQSQILESGAAAADAAALARGFAQLYPIDAKVRQRLRTVWNGLVSAAISRHAFAQLRTCLDIQRRFFPAERECFRYAAEALNELEDYPGTLERYSEVPKAREYALMALERWDEVTSDPAGYRQAVARAYVETGRFAELAATCPEVGWGGELANFYSGRIDLLDAASRARGSGRGLFAQTLAGDFAGILSGAADSEQGMVFALCCLDRSQEAFAALPAPRDANVLLPAYLLGGSAERALRELPLRLAGRQWARYSLALECRIAGDADGESRLMRQIDGDLQYPGAEQSFFPRFILRPFLGMLATADAGALQRAAAAMKAHRYLGMQRVWYLGRLLAGEISDEEFLRQPCAVTAPALLLIGKGFSAEARGDAAAALAAWRGFMALPVQRRVIDFFMRDALIERFARWRIQQLDRPHP